MQHIGKVTRWKRAKDEKDRTLDFGFADFASPKDALKVLRIAPYITVMDRTWIVKADKRVEIELQSFQSSLTLNPSYNPQADFRDDQKTLKIINDQISSATFAKGTNLIHGVIISEFDEARETEHFRYLSEIRKENEEFEIIFKTKLLKQKALEVKVENEKKEFEELQEETYKRKERREFLKNWKPQQLPDLTDESAVADFAQKWTEFEYIRKLRKEIRAKEHEIESKISLQ